MDTPKPAEHPIHRQYKDTPPPSPATLRELGIDPRADRLHTYFLLRMQLKHCNELAKEMDNSDGDMRHLAGVMARAAARFLSTAQLFESLNTE